jgi:hypothetical protein
MDYRREQQQKMFDMVVRHLLGQRAKAVDELGQCRYRAPDGRRCAIGSLVTDAVYSPLMEGRGAGHQIVVGVLEAAGYVVLGPTGVGEGFLRDLQHIHDNESVERWASSLRNFADLYHLDATSLPGPSSGPSTELV